MLKEDMIDSKRDLSREWIKNNVYEALEKIEELERHLRTGCSDLIEYIERAGMGISCLPDIELKAMELSLVEMHILLQNVKKLIKKDVYESLINELNYMIKVFEKGEQVNGETIKVATKLRNEVKRQTQTKLTPLFSILRRRVILLRSKLVENLSHILFIGNENERRIV